MPIKVTCRCGQQFAAKDELAGKVVKCPKCKQPLKVEPPTAGKKAGNPPGAQAASATPSAVAALLDEVGFHVHEDKADEALQRCPACDEKISDHAVICVYCGYNLETGRFIKGASGVGVPGRKAEGHEGAAQMLLKKAETAIEQDKDEEHKMRSQGMPLWMLISILSMIATFTIGMSILPADRAFTITGYVWIGVCGTLAVFYWFWLVVLAFKENIKQGLLVEFVPFYAFYYVFKRWADVGKVFMTHVTLLILLPLGLILLALAPKMKKAPGNEVSWLFRQPPAVTISAQLAPVAEPEDGSNATGVPATKRGVTA